MTNKSARAKAETTEDAVLGGRLRLRQPRRGHRVGHDAILLAAACPAAAGDTVVDLGAGVGGAGLAVAMRVPGTKLTLVEIDPKLAALAAENARLNRMARRVRSVVLDVTDPPQAFAAAGLKSGSIARVLMNPPFNDSDRLQSSPDAARRLAHAAPRDRLAAWVTCAARLLRHRGTLTLIWRAGTLADVFATLDAAFGGIDLLPVYSKPDQPAIRIILTAVKGSRGPLRLRPPLMLADASGSTVAADAVLRHGAALQ